MGIKNTISRKTTLADNTIVGDNVDIESGANPIIRESIPANSTQLPVNSCTFDKSKLQGITMHATVDMTVETNDAETPDDTITLKAGKALTWELNESHFGAGGVPFSANVTALFVTSVAAGVLTISPIVDPT